MESALQCIILEDAGVVLVKESFPALNLPLRLGTRSEVEDKHQRVVSKARLGLTHTELTEFLTASPTA